MGYTVPVMERFVHHGTVIEWEFVRHPRARGMKLKVYKDGRVVVTTSPRFLGIEAAQRLIERHSDLIVRAQAHAKLRPPPMTLKGSALEYKKLKRLALAVVRERLDRFAPIYGVHPGRISIRNQKSRWGSCSVRGTLSFHYKIAVVPRPLADYLVVHELCHMRSFDHSARFWGLIEKTIPDYKRMRKLLVKFGGGEED